MFDCVIEVCFGLDHLSLVLRDRCFGLGLVCLILALLEQQRIVVQGGQNRVGFDLVGDINIDRLHREALDKRLHVDLVYGTYGAGCDDPVCQRFLQGLGHDDRRELCFRGGRLAGLLCRKR
ncbi:hypothetical protein D3C87_1664030 [compost metagenome]